MIIFFNNNNKYINISFKDKYSIPKLNEQINNYG